RRRHLSPPAARVGALGLASAPLLAFHSHGSVGQVAVHVRLPDPVVLADPDRGQLAALDQPIDRHVRDPHGPGHLADGEQAAPHERSSLAYFTTSTNATGASCATS